QAEEPWMAQAPVARPLGEADLGDELGLDPRRAAYAGDLVVAGERAAVARKRAHLRAELLEHLAVEPGPDLARVDQVAVAVVAEEQRAELLARAARCGE